MRITFVLPGYARAPIGGFKIVYEYANRLVSRGHEVNVVHPRNLSPKYTWSERADALVWKYGLRVLERPLLPWFPIDPRVQMHFTADLEDDRIPPGDVIVATAWQTVQWVARASALHGRKLYLIQHYEVWSGEEAEVTATW